MTNTPTRTPTDAIRRQDAERLAISYAAFRLAMREFIQAPSPAGFRAVRVWARTLKADQIVAGVDVVSRADLDWIGGRAAT